MEIKGTIVQALGIESGTSKKGKAWAKSSIVIQTEGQYPKKIMLTNFKDVEAFVKLPVGTYGTFYIEVESREWTNQNTGRTSWFTEVSCWKWEVITAAQPQKASAQQGWQSAYPQPQPQAQTALPQSEDDGLPF